MRLRRFSPAERGDWVNSVITLCAPHNGSSLTEVLDSVGGVVGITDTTEMLARLCFGAADISSPVDGIYDFKLDQFGINSAAGSEKGGRERHQGCHGVRQRSRRLRPLARRRSRAE